MLPCRTRHREEGGARGVRHPGRIPCPLSRRAWSGAVRSGEQNTAQCAATAALVLRISAMWVCLIRQAGSML